jgi:asparagine synthase (glutamine-hydrolysing)
MCGLIAITSPEVPVRPEDLHAALARLQHRGPDGHGTWFSPDGRTALGHARLAIIDLHTGAQPLASEDAQVHLIVNGELYESDRLRSSLEARGHRLKTRSDSEVALHLYEELGVDCLRLLRGEFAFVLWDGKARRLLAARDRFGIKPLYYAWHGGRLLLASEVKALFAAGVPAAWDEEGMFQALHFCQAQDRTLYRGVMQVPPGHYLLLEKGQLQVRPYWDTDYPSRGQRPTPPSEPECIHTLGRLIEESIRIRLRADVPLACYLSGGVDSSSVLGIAQRLHGGRIGAFTVAFEHKDYDESPVAEEMARQAGADFHPVRVTSQDFADVFEEAVAHGEMPHYNGHGPARYLLSRAVSRAGFKVALGGEGADELFAGYHFVQQALRRSGNSAPFNPLQLAGRLLRWPGEHERTLAGISPLLATLVRVLGFPDSLLGYLTEKATALRGMLAPSFLERHQGRDPYREFLARFPWRKLATVEPFQVVLHLWMKSHFPNYVLAAERLDMAHAVELRLPYLDHHLFEYTRDLPASLLFAGKRNKHLLRATVAPDVSETVRQGPKRPFFAPPSAASRQNPLYTLAQDLIRGPAFGRVPFFHQPSVVKLLDSLDALPDAQRASLDPLFFFLASLAVLGERYRLS